MSEIVKGDIMVSREGFEYEVIAVNDDHFWGRFTGEGGIGRIMKLDSFTKVPPFFKKGGKYRKSSMCCTYTILDIGQHRDKKLAIYEYECSGEKSYGVADTMQSFFEKD